ncbi:TonB-dependent receptor, partial [Ferruginibacter sp. HRS2-29]|uniref:TonB-dependent receptor n=1 Tax=Ferruginibacter sp. HRS2-29 TaxID=2487334 RepID=UPI0026E5104E
MFRSVFLLISLCSCFASIAQTGTITGNISSGKTMVEAASIEIPKLGIGSSSDSNGNFMLNNIPRDKSFRLQISSKGFVTAWQTIQLSSDTLPLRIVLEKADASMLSDVVVTGTMKEISRTASPVPVEIITPKLFQKNPTPSLFEAVGMVNGVKPQLNCNVCNTGDIHINGMEGPYTMILIDGMPIVSALSTVYGLSGIPNSMVERIEVVKGPASSLYGSEAMGGIINVITKNPVRAPLVSTDIFGTSWGELSVDVAAKMKTRNATSLLGVNYFNYQQKHDKNNDGFTDMTLQNRISVFNKWNFTRKENRLASIAGRFVYEDRWGGQTSWGKQWRGTDSIYGESIYTRRAEIIGVYQLPTREKIFTQFSFNKHDQNSYYGKVPYFATQQVVFLQTYWDKKISGSHSLLMGGSVRYTHYDDNTPGTASPDGRTNQPTNTFLPGVFIQDEWSISPKHTLLAGYRFDHDKNHGSVHSPRVAYKYAPNNNNIVRASMGTGFRVVNLFTEDHAALTGAREVVIASALRPERSYNANLNYVLKIPTDHFYLGFDITGFYSYFTNKIIGDFDTDPNKII